MVLSESFNGRKIHTYRLENREKPRGIYFNLKIYYKVLFRSTNGTDGVKFHHLVDKKANGKEAYNW